MNILAVNGSPRRHKNTETVLEHAVRGAGGSRIAQLYPMRWSGCIGCYKCKKRDKVSSLCRFEDELTPLLEEAQEADVLLVATPVYFFTESAATRAFIERLLYPWTGFFADGYGTRRPKPMVAGLIYTLANTEGGTAEHGHGHFTGSTRQFFSLHFSHHECLMVYETLHAEHYGKYAFDAFDADARKKVHEEQFPKDCERAYALGASLAAKAREL